MTDNSHVYGPNGEIGRSWSKVRSFADRLPLKLYGPKIVDFHPAYTMLVKMSAPAEALGALKIRVFSELSQEQRELLASDYPNVVQQSWRPRASWKDAPHSSSRCQ